MSSAHGAVLQARFISPPEQVYPAPFPNVFLVLNGDSVLALYRVEDGLFKHVWSIGRFRAVEQVAWSLDGALIAIIGSKKCFIYSAEEGKRLAAIPLLGVKSKAAWLALRPGINVLAVLDCESLQVQWNVGGEFLLPSIKLSSASTSPVCGFAVDAAGSLLLAHTDGSIVRLLFPFADRTHEVEIFSQLSSAINQLNRCLAGLVETGHKLIALKLDVTNQLRGVEEASGAVFSKLLLHGSQLLKVKAPLRGFPTEAEFLDWKTRMKKQRSELLVQSEEARQLLVRFAAKFSNVPSVVKVAEELLGHQDGIGGPIAAFESENQAARKELASWLEWLEPMVLNSATEAGPLLPLKLAVSLVKTIISDDSDLASANRMESFPACGIVAACMAKLTEAFEKQRLELQSMALTHAELADLGPGDWNIYYCNEQVLLSASIDGNMLLFALADDEPKKVIAHADSHLTAGKDSIMAWSSQSRRLTRIPVGSQSASEILFEALALQT